MKKTLSILLISIILFGCSKDPLKKSVIEPLEVDEIKQILKYEKERVGVRCCFELFYEDVQEFHESIKNDNLTKIKFEDLLYGDYWRKMDYIIEFDKGSRGYLYSDSIKSLVQNSGWEKIPMYVSIFDTLSSVRLIREKIEGWNEKDGYNPYITLYGELDSKRMENHMKLEMCEFISNKIEITNDSIYQIQEKGKSNKILLLEEFEDKMIELRVKNRRR